MLAFFAPAEATLMMAMPQAQALQQLHRWVAQPLPLNASCWVHDDTAQPAQDFLFVRLRGAVAAVESALTRMSADAQALGLSVDDTYAEALAQLRGQLSPMAKAARPVPVDAAACSSSSAGDCSS